MRLRRQFCGFADSENKRRGRSHVTCFPPAPLRVPGRHFWSLHPPEELPRQTHYPSRPGSAPAAYHSLYALVSAKHTHTDKKIS